MSECIVLAAINQWPGIKSQTDLAEKIGVSRAIVSKTYVRAVELGMKLERSFTRGGWSQEGLERQRLGKTRAQTPKHWKGKKLSELLKSLGINKENCNLLNFGRTGRVSKGNFWEDYKGRHVWILKDIRAHFGKEVAIHRYNHDRCREERTVQLWAEIRDRFKSKGITL